MLINMDYSWRENGDICQIYKMACIKIWSTHILKKRLFGVIQGFKLAGDVYFRSSFWSTSCGFLHKRITIVYHN